MTLDEKEISTIKKSHKLYHGNAAEAATKLPYSQQTILKYWKEENLPINNRGGMGLCFEDVDSMINVYEKCGGNASEASRQLGFSAQTITKYWDEIGFQKRGKGGDNRSLCDDDVILITNLYWPCNENASEASRQSGFSVSTIAKYWKQANLKIEGKRKKKINDLECRIRVNRSTKSILYHGYNSNT